MNISDVGDIVEGHVNELLGRNKEIGDLRIEVCLKCPIVKMTVVGPICDSAKWINKEDQVSDVALPGYVRGCNCRTLAKVTLPEAHCIIGKW